jgi:putative endonuclease
LTTVNDLGTQEQHELPGKGIYHVYIVRCGDGSLYTGYTTDDVQARLDVHRQGKGAKYTRGRGPLELVYTEELDSYSAALKREWEIKKLTRAQKEELICCPNQRQSNSSP